MSGTSDHILQLDELGRVLNSMEPTLQVLKLDIDGLKSGVLGPLRNCTRLRCLETTLYHLVSFTKAVEGGRT